MGLYGVVVIGRLIADDDVIIRMCGRKFWTRNRLGDAMRDRYNLNTLPFGVFDDTFDGTACRELGFIHGIISVFGF